MGETGAVPDTVIRVVLADDHPVVLAGLRALLGTLAGFEVVGEAGDGESVVRQVELTHPEVVLMDLRMPGTDGLEATRRIRAAAPDTAVLVLTMLDDEETIFAAMRAGAHGYLLKGAGQHELERALRGVVVGEAIFGPGVAARMLKHFADGDRGGDGDGDGDGVHSTPFSALTGRGPATAAATVGLLATHTTHPRSAAQPAS